MCKFSEGLYNEGKAEGKAEGEARLASLIQKLLAASRGEDVQKAVADPEYRIKFYGQYGITP